MFIILLYMLLFLEFPYVFAKDGDTVSVYLPVFQGDSFQIPLKIYLELFAFINYCLILIFQWIVVSDDLELFNKAFTSFSLGCISINGYY